MTARDTVLTRLLALNDAAARWLTARDALLPLLAQPLAGPVLDAKGNVLVDEEGNVL